jgi:hypothetical protein
MIFRRPAAADDHHVASPDRDLGGPLGADHLGQAWIMGRMPGSPAIGGGVPMKSAGG